MGEKLDKGDPQGRRGQRAEGLPSCGTKPFFKHCVVCGFEIVKPSLIEAQAGVMREVMLGKKKLADNRMDMYAQCVTYARSHSTPDKSRPDAQRTSTRTLSASGHRASGALMRRRTSRSRPTPEQDQGEQHSLRQGQS